MKQQAAITPWYRQGWPWALMAGPAAVVVAGGYTIWLAISNPEALVVDDYYKQGTTINQTLRRDHAAAELGLSGRLALNAEGKMGLDLVAKPDYAWPPVVELLLAHPTRSEQDLKIQLLAVSLANGQGRYVAAAPKLQPVAYQVVLQDGDKWRLLGQWPKNADHPVDLTPSVTSLKPAE